MRSQGSQADLKRTRFSMKFFVKLQSVEMQKQRLSPLLLFCFSGGSQTSCLTLATQLHAMSLLVGFFKAFKLLIATFDGQVQSFFRLLFTAPNAFQFLINDGANLNKVAQTHAT